MVLEEESFDYPNKPRVFSKKNRVRNLAFANGYNEK